MSFNELPNELLDNIFNNLIYINGIYKSKHDMKSTPLMLELKNVFNNDFCADHFTFSRLNKVYRGDKKYDDINATYDVGTGFIHLDFALYPQDYQPTGAINIAKTCVKCIKKSNNMFSGMCDSKFQHTLNLMQHGILPNYIEYGHYRSHPID